MKTAIAYTYCSKLTWLFSSILLFTSTGCVTFTRHAVPASRLPHQYEAPTKCNLHPINFQLLAKPSQSEHRLGAGDVVGIIIPGVLPPSDGPDTTLISNQTTLSRLYYPPLGSVNSPTIGIPFTIQGDCSLNLPGIPSIAVEGLRLEQAQELITKQFTDAEILKNQQYQVQLTLIKSRVNRIVVFREDASNESASMVSRGQVVLHKRGSSTVVDLPEAESDILHAMAASGGLPGVDAYNEVWVLRRNSITEEAGSLVENQLSQGTDMKTALESLPTSVSAVRIPLKLCVGEALNFSAEDVALNNGDVVYIEPRRDEFYYTGGLLPGGQYPLPRDEDIDIIEAIAQATGSVGGLGGTSSVAVLRAGAGIGNIIPPSRVLVLRKLPNGQQLAIRVDLAEATRSPSERIKIMAGDYIMMYYKPGESLMNGALNFFNLNVGTSL